MKAWDWLIYKAPDWVFRMVIGMMYAVGLVLAVLTILGGLGLAGLL